MRIVAGKYRSRKLVAPEGMNTRPTWDQVREAVFSSLGGSFTQGNFFDPFAGSGAFGFEALSRGYTKAILADRDPEAIMAIKQNKNSLKLNDECEIWLYDYHKSLKQAVRKELKFDLIYLDPPYELNKYEEILTLIEEGKLLNPQGRIVVESGKGLSYNYPGSLVKYKEATYGKAVINYFVEANQ